MSRVSWPFPLLLAVGLALATTGCLAKHNVGIGNVSFAPTERTDLSCLGVLRGTTATLGEGEHAGRPVVSLSGVVVGFSPVLTESFAVDGAQVFVGQSCLVRQRLCDSALVVKNGARRLAVYWTQAYRAGRPLPATARELFDRARTPLVDLLRAVDLDKVAAHEVETLAMTRSGKDVDHTTLTLPGGGAALSPELVNAAASIRVPDDLKASAGKYPRLAPLVLALGLVSGGDAPSSLGGNGFVCVGETTTWAPRPAPPAATSPPPAASR
jgi:hypothetical protein